MVALDMVPPAAVVTVIVNPVLVNAIVSEMDRVTPALSSYPKVQPVPALALSTVLYSYPPCKVPPSGR